MTTSIADKLGIGNEAVRELRLGGSFMNSGNSAFHSVRYDFKPASVDATKVATVDIGEGHQVAVTVPHIEGSGTAHTVFKGSRKPYQKECVLIIDHTTGEITLEKLSYNIQLKKTRAEGSSRIQQRPVTPIDREQRDREREARDMPVPPSGKNYSPSGAQKCSPSSSQKTPHSPNQKLQWSSSNAGHHTSSPGNQSMSKTSPNQPSPSMPCLVAPSGGGGSSSGSAASSAVRNPNVNPKDSRGDQQQIGMSMPSLVSGSNSASAKNDRDEAPPHVGVLSESSDSSDSSSSGASSGSESSDSESEAEEQPAPPVVQAAHSRPQVPSANSIQPHAQQNVLLSMPRFSTLSEDLRLSESGSDSDS